MRRTSWWWLAGTLATVIGCGDNGGGGNNPPPADAAPDTSGSDGGTDAMKQPDVAPDTMVQPDVMVPPDTMAGCTNAGEMRCGDTCIDVSSNNMNCGSCGNACMGAQVCRMGACVDDMPCPMGQQRCGTACVNTTTDAMNCGSCGNACPMGQTCTGGSCMAPPMCPTGQTACGSACVDTNTDAANCGRCGTACMAGQTCTGGMCTGMACPTGQTSCGGACVNTQTDAANCGACGTACMSGQVCMGGACMAMACPTGQMRCGTTCVNTTNDPMNCGSCGTACATGQMCAMGMCSGMVTCPMGQMLCGTGAMAACADTNTDASNCGTCGRACAMGQVCMGGMCTAPRMMCPTGQTDCTPMAATPTCVDTATSNMNCGMCGNVCPTGTACRMGACACTTMGQTLCGRSCVNTATDASNCGRCGNACPTGRVCTGGMCGCAMGQTLCGGTCVNTQTDNANCGACGTTCSGGQTCTAGRCACATGQTLCGTGATAACANLMTDRANCGMCARACSMGQTCTGGMCACPTGQTLCGTGAMAACTDTNTNASNCGMCGRVCPTGVPCMRGTCMGTPPANDLRTGATVINLAAGTAQNLTADTTSARHDATGPCFCANGNDVFYTFTLTQPEYIYADTLGATWDTALYIQARNAMTGAITDVTPATGSGQVACNDDAGGAGLCLGISGLQSQILMRLGPGQYYLVLSGCSAGMATIHFQHLPAGNGTQMRIAPNATVQPLMGTVAGVGTLASACCSGGAENSAWWLSCPGTASAAFNATSCSAATGTNQAAYNIEIAQYSALRAGTAVSVCNNDTTLICNQGATVNSTIPTTAANQVGLNTLVVDSCSGAGAYTVNYILANCASGSRCGAACADTTNDENHCGGCFRRCSPGQLCLGGTCMTRPAGDVRDNAIAVDMTRASSTFTVNTTTYQNDTTGTCSCTSGNDVFYRFTIAAGQEELVYADTIGSANDTSLFFQNSTGTNLTAAGIANGSVCNDDAGLAGCATGLRSQVMARLATGTYYLVLSGCTAGAASVRFQHLPIGNGSLTALAAGTSTPMGTTAGTGRINVMCGTRATAGAGPEDTYYWYTCGSSPTGTFTASTCGRATWDTVLDQRSAARATVSVCNDDVGGTCGVRSSVTATIPAGPGIHTLYVDGYTGTALPAFGAYSVSVVRP